MIPSLDLNIVIFFCRPSISYIGKKHLETAMREVLSNPSNAGANSQSLAFAVIRVPFFLEPEYDESKPFIESNRDRLVKKWGGKEGWERQKHHHECVSAYCSCSVYNSTPSFAST